jgi:hypothetical protein
MLRKMTFALTLSVCIMGLYTQSLKADQSNNSDAESLLTWNYDAAAVPVTDRERTIAVSAAATGEPQKKMHVKHRSSEKEGFIAPTLDGPWRFTFASWGWLPDVPIKIKLGDKEVDIPLDLGKIIDDLQFTAMLDFEVRKGSFGIYATPIFIFLEDSEHVQGPLRSHKVTVNDNAYLTDFGLSYELGRWHLGKKPDSPAVTVEPFAGARWLIDEIKIKISPGGPFHPGKRTFNPDIDFIAPVVGVRTFWDVTEHWNFRAEGDYGGFNTDHLKETWNVLGIVGYRFRPKKHKNLAINLFAGYRYLYARYKKVAELEVAVKGPLIGIGFEF